MKKTITATLLLFSMAIISVSCKSPQGVDYRDVQNFRIEKVGFDRSSVMMDLVFFNPNNFGIDLKHLDFDIYVDNSFVGKFTLDTTMRISKKSEFVLPSKIDVDMRNLFKNALNVLLSNEILVNVKGNSRVGKGGIFINVPFNYSGRQKVSFN